MQVSSDIRSLSKSNLEKILLKENFEKYRASQIFDWLNKGNVRSFEEMKNLNKILGFAQLSMGMSSDFLIAAKHQSTFIRIGSSIFGRRS